MRKKLVSVLLFITVTVVTKIPAYAQSVHKTSFSMNEYEYITNLKSQSDSELLKGGFTTDEIKKLREFSFEKRIKNFSGWDQNMYLDESTAECDVVYQIDGGDSFATTGSAEGDLRIDAANGAATFKFDDTQGPAPGDGNVMYGSGCFRVTKIDDEIPEIGVITIYGHGTFTSSFSLSYSRVPLALSFQDGSADAGEIIYIKNFN